MLKSTEPKKSISFKLNPEYYYMLTRFAESENRKINNAARYIIMQFLRSYEKDED